MVQSVSCNRARLILLRSSMSSPRQSPVMPCPAIAAKTPKRTSATQVQSRARKLYVQPCQHYDGDNREQRDRVPRSPLQICVQRLRYSLSHDSPPVPMISRLCTSQIGRSPGLRGQRIRTYRAAHSVELG